MTDDAPEAKGRVLDELHPVVADSAVSRLGVFGGAAICLVHARGERCGQVSSEVVWRVAKGLKRRFSQ